MNSPRELMSSVRKHQILLENDISQAILYSGSCLLWGRHGRQTFC